MITTRFSTIQNLDMSLLQIPRADPQSNLFQLIGGKRVGTCYRLHHAIRLELHSCSSLGRPENGFGTCPCKKMHVMFIVVEVFSFCERRCDMFVTSFSSISYYSNVRLISKIELGQKFQSIILDVHASAN